MIREAIIRWLKLDERYEAKAQSCRRDIPTDTGLAGEGSLSPEARSP